MTGRRPPSPDAQADGYRLVPLLNPAQKTEYVVGCAAWLAAALFFWVWWLDPAHVIGPGRFAVISAIVAWVTLLPAYFLILFYGSRKPAGALQLPPGSRIAMVVTKAPSEPFAVVAETLEAMLAQDLRQSHAYDVWLADEDPDAATLRWCAERGIQVSTRKGVEAYHRAQWPRRTRCKEGNLAYFYDHYGYDRYDFVAQFDADHVPTPSYLREILKPFADAGVGYVSAPSICDKNAESSWSARGRLYAEASMHGALQAGYNGGWAPLCIGSHYAVRTAALKQIGGLGPELAEDHSTTLMMNAGGWRGVHAVDAIAHGDGPSSFADLVTQEFQWSRSLVMILLGYTPGCLATLSPKLRFQFLFSQFWYPLFSLAMAAMFAMPVLALTIGANFANVTYPAFLMHFVPMALVLTTMAYRWRRAGVFRPHAAKVLSWEAALFLLARWPWSLAGCLAAVRDWITGSFVDFRVTPKGGTRHNMLPVRVIVPYVALSLVSVVPVLAFSDVGSARGFYIFGICNGLIYAGLLLVIVARHLRENHIALLSRSGQALAQVAMAGCLLLPPAGAVAWRGTEGLDALARGAGRLALTKSTFNVAGAGQNASNRRTLRLQLHWRSDRDNADD